MQRRFSTLIAATVVAGSALLGCAAGGQGAQRVNEPARSWTDSVLATLSLRDKAAQMVWPTILGEFAPEDAAGWERIRSQLAMGVGGYTISVGSPTEIAAKLNAMQREARVPLLFGADLEFGTGFRARGGYFLPNGIDLGGAVLFPQQMAVGATGDSALAYEQGRVTALEGRAIGIHIAYAPLLDVNNNPANPVINTRSYGEDPAIVGRLGVGFVRGLQEHGMIATGKHFPGHGDTEVNSHLALPTVNVSRARLDSVELPPFQAAIDAGLGAIMSFHGAMPALDPSGAPGTLSHAVLTGLLREEMGFDGLIISDAMDMRGVLDQYGAVEATKRAVAAGADILIQPDDVAGMIDAIVTGVGEGRFDEARLDASVRRILAAKASVGLDRTREVPLDRIRGAVGTADALAAARTIADRSITLARDVGGRVPLAIPQGRRVLSITYARRPDLGAGTTFDAELRRAVPGTRSLFIDAEHPATDWARVRSMADSAEVVIVGSYMGQRWDAVSAGAPRAFADFVRGMQQSGKDPIVVAFGNPYLLQQLPDLRTYLIAWGGIPASQSAAARALTGEIPIGGKLPIAIPGLAPLGTGEMRTAARRE